MTQSELKIELKNFLKQFCGPVSGHDSQVDSYLENWSNGLADIMQRFVTSKKVKIGIPVSTSGGGGSTTGPGIINDTGA